MSHSISFLAPDGAADIEDVSIDESGTHVLLKDGHTCSLLGHEAKTLPERMRPAPSL